MAFDAYTEILLLMEQEREFCEQNAVDFAKSERYEDAARAKALANGIWWLLTRHKAACKKAAASADTYATQLAKADLEREGV